MNKTISLLVLLSFCGLVYPQLSPGVTGNPQTICYGTAPERLSFITPPSGGAGAYTYRWQRSNTNDNNWTDISGASASRDYYYPPVLGRTTAFRCRVTDEAMTSVTTNSITITVLEDLSAGSIQGSQTVFAGTEPYGLTESSAPAGGTGPGSYSYRWQRSSDGWHWTDIAGANSYGYAPGPLVADQWFRRFVVDAQFGSIATDPIIISVSNLTLYGNDTPSVIATSYGVPLDLGTEFRTVSDGIITKVRLFSGADERGIHQIRLWRKNDNSEYELFAGPYDWDVQSETAGWKEYNLNSPVQVEAFRYYMVSVSTSEDNLWAFSSNYVPASSNNYINYTGSYYIGPIGQVPSWPADENSGFFRDVVFIPFSPGSAGVSQEICYNSIPAPLTETAEPSGASGDYTYQWQMSVDGSVWTDIPGASSADYSPINLTAQTRFRRNVTSGDLITTGNTIVITVNPRFSLAQLESPENVYANTATNISIALEGGSQPYSIHYTRNTLAMSPVTGYFSGDDIYTGILNGSYIYELTQVTDSLGCEVESLGSPVSITASGQYNGTETKNALIIVNSQSESYRDYNLYIRPYLDWFGIPYDTCNIASMALPYLQDYAIVLLGHREVYDSGYPITEIENALLAGTGFYSFDPHFFDFETDFSSEDENQEVIHSHMIEINFDHFITKYHENDDYHPTNNLIEFPIINNSPVQIAISETEYTLDGATDLAIMTSYDEVSLPLLQVASYGNGRIVKWNSYDWMYDDPRILGPVSGMDDLLWRSIVWAAEKPFVMQGVQPMITMRVDDVDGRGGYGGTEIYMKDLEWLKISNEYGFIPWCGTFIHNTTENFYPILRELIDNNLATASPHSFDYDDNFLFHFHPLRPEEEESFDAADNVVQAWGFYAENSIQASKYIVPHWYALAGDALAPLAQLGIEYIGTYLPYDYDEYPGNWLNCGPYRDGRYGAGVRGYPLFYSGPVNWLGNEFFVCLTEIQDDGGYEWYPDANLEVGVEQTIYRGVRHLRRAINSMVLPTLFTHEDRLKMTSEQWRQILSEITSAISSYYPEYDIVYRSMDDACQYMRAKVNLKIENVTAQNGIVGISCSGLNDAPTKCFLFTENLGQIHMKMTTLPRVTDSENPITVCITE